MIGLKSASLHTKSEHLLIAASVIIVEPVQSCKWLQAIRLVKNSIIAIESPEAEVDDVDFVDDLEEVHDVVERFRRSEQQIGEAPAAEQADRRQGKEPTSPLSLPLSHDAPILRLSQ